DRCVKVGAEGTGQVSLVDAGQLRQFLERRLPGASVMDRIANALQPSGNPALTTSSAAKIFKEPRRPALKRQWPLRFCAVKLLQGWGGSDAQASALGALQGALGGCISEGERDDVCPLGAVLMRMLLPHGSYQQLPRSQRNLMAPKTVNCPAGDDDHQRRLLVSMFWDFQAGRLYEFPHHEAVTGDLENRAHRWHWFKHRRPD